MGEDSDEDDTYSSEGYQRRAEWFEDIREERMMVQGGGADSVYLEGEVKANYIHANFISAIITSACRIERILYSQVVQCDPERREEQHNLHGTIVLAKKYDVVADDVTDTFETLEDISDFRNGVVHYREGHEEDSLTKREHADFEGFHPNRFGKESAERILKAMFDIEQKCSENQRKFWNWEGPLRQGINTVKTGKDVHCDNCGFALQDVQIDYHVKWDGNEIVSQSVECPSCGVEVISKFRDSTE